MFLKLSCASFSIFGLAPKKPQTSGNNPKPVDFRLLTLGPWMKIQHEPSTFTLN